MAGAPSSSCRRRALRRLGQPARKEGGAGGPGRWVGARTVRPGSRRSRCGRVSWSCWGAAYRRARSPAPQPSSGISPPRPGLLPPFLSLIQKGTQPPGTFDLDLTVPAFLCGWRSQGRCGRTWHPLELRGGETPLSFGGSSGTPRRRGFAVTCELAAKRCAWCGEGYGAGEVQQGLKGIPAGSFNRAQGLGTVCVAGGKAPTRFVWGLRPLQSPLQGMERICAPGDTCS